MATIQERRLRQLKQKLERLETDEIRAMVETNRIRGADRRAVAQEILASRAAKMSAGRELGETGKVVPFAGPIAIAEKIREAFIDATSMDGVADAASKRSTPYRIGRVLGIAMALGGVAFLVYRLVRS
jgi:hypothetical protein